VLQRRSDARLQGLPLSQSPHHPAPSALSAKGEPLTESEPASNCLQMGVLLTIMPRRCFVAERISMNSMNNNNITVGKYLVSPLTKLLDDGRYAASVSIRSGRGSGTHDRVMRFTPVFGSNCAAAHYATAQGLSWVQARSL
jgi:hypothetical protein